MCALAGGPPRRVLVQAVAHDEAVAMGLRRDQPQAGETTHVAGDVLPGRGDVPPQLLVRRSHVARTAGVLRCQPHQRPRQPRLHVVEPHLRLVVVQPCERAGQRGDEAQRGVGVRRQNFQQARAREAVDLRTPTDDFRDTRRGAVRVAREVDLSA